MVEDLDVEAGVLEVEAGAEAEVEDFNETKGLQLKL